MGALGAQRGGHEAATAESLQLVAVVEVLAQALVALGEDGGQLARAQQPVCVGGARHGVAGLARGLAEHRHVEDHVGGQQSQIAMRRVVVVHRHRSHQAIERQHPGVVGDHQRGAGHRQVLDTADLNPEPRLEKHSQQRQKDCVVEMGIEPELVDGVVAHHSLADELRDRGDPFGEFVRGLLRSFAHPPAPPLRRSSISRTTAAICSAEARLPGSEGSEGCRRELSARAAARR